MSFTDAIKTCLSNYVTFSGRAGRPEYWWFVLFVFLGALITGALDALVFGTGPAPDFGYGAGHGRGDEPTRIFQPVFQLAIFLPLLAAGWRRLHDTGRPGWLLLLPLGVALATVLLMLGGLGMMMGSGQHGMPNMSPMSPGMGYGVFGAIWVVQLAITLLLLWWLTRPGDPEANAFGPPPAHPPATPPTEPPTEPPSAP